MIPKKLAAGDHLRQTDASKAGQVFVGPGNERHANEGLVGINVKSESGQPCSGDFAVADGLMKPLAAMSQLCNRGNLSIFDNDGSCLINRDS